MEPVVIGGKYVNLMTEDEDKYESVSQVDKIIDKDDNDLKNISDSLKKLADLKSTAMYSISPNIKRDVLKELVFPLASSGVGTFGGLIAGTLFHKLHILNN